MEVVSASLSAFAQDSIGCFSHILIQKKAYMYSVTDSC